MSVDEQPSFGDSEVAEMNRILQKVLAQEEPTADELEFLRALRLDVVDLIQHSRRVL